MSEIKSTEPGVAARPRSAAQRFEVVYYAKENRERPAEEAILSMDDEMAAKVGTAAWQGSRSPSTSEMRVIRVDKGYRETLDVLLQDPSFKAEYDALEFGTQMERMLMQMQIQRDREL